MAGVSPSEAAPLGRRQAVLLSGVILGVWHWPAVISHAAINANVGVVMLFQQGDPSRLLGPTATGVVGSLPLAVFALWLLLRSDSFVVRAGSER